MRSRKCESPAPAYGDRNCTLDSEDAKDCEIKQCGKLLIVFADFMSQ